MMIFLSLFSFAIPAVIAFGIKCNDEQIELPKTYSPESFL